MIRRRGDSVTQQTNNGPHLMADDNQHAAHAPVRELPLTSRQNSLEAAAAEQHIQQVQVAQTVRAIPLLLMFHAAAALNLYYLAKPAVSPALLQLWYAAVMLSGASFVAVFFLWQRPALRERPHRMLRALELFCLLLALAWAMPVAAVTHVAEAAGLVPVAGVTLAMMSVGAISLLRVPVGAIVFLCLVSATLARSLFHGLDSNQGMAVMLCIVYCLVLVGITLNSHLSFRRQALAELEIRRQSDVIRLLLNDFERGTTDFLWETGADGCLTYHSPRLAEILAKPGESLVGQRFGQCLADMVQAQDLRAFEQALAGQSPIEHLHLSLTLFGKSVFWSMAARPLTDTDGRVYGFRGVGRDVTTREEARRSMAMAMEASEKGSAAKSRFLAVMSHELRTPINAIVGFSELLARDKDQTLTGTQRIEFSNAVLESAAHLQALINDLLDATRMERGSLTLHEQPSDAAEVTESAIRLCRDQATKANVSVVARLTDGIGLTCDVTRIKQVLINLITNAIKFSQGGGIVNVDMQRGANGQLVVSIRDGGIGIASDCLEQVFEPFVQVDDSLSRRFGGVGLGLPIARRLARLHGGDVTLESAPGSGTTAKLHLPPERITWPAKRVPAVDAESKNLDRSVA